jgi:hypothetical protein
MPIHGSFIGPRRVEQGHGKGHDWLTFLDDAGNRLAVHMPEHVVIAMAKAFNEAMSRPAPVQPPGTADAIFTAADYAKSRGQ